MLAPAGEFFVSRGDSVGDGRGQWDVGQVSLKLAPQYSFWRNTLIEPLIFRVASSKRSRTMSV